MRWVFALPGWAPGLFASTVYAFSIDPSATEAGGAIKPDATDELLVQ